MYNVRAKWPGIDSRPLAKAYHDRTGQSIIVVHPSELYMEPDDSSKTGYSLWYQDNSTGEPKQRVEQCALELFQDELAELDPLILRQLAGRSVNDFRTTLLCHDKRLLGIISEELPGLVRRQKFTTAEAAQLESAIATTLLPGSKQLRSLLEESRGDSRKDDYIIKPIRDGSCQGIRLGKNMSQAEWVAELERLAQRALRPHEAACVVQKLVEHVEYDIVRHDVPSVPGGEKFHIIGSGHMINSRLYVHGPWRLGKEVHVGLGKEEKGIVMSAVLRPELPVLEEKEEEDGH